MRVKLTSGKIVKKMFDRCKLRLNKVVILRLLPAKRHSGGFCARTRRSHCFPAADSRG